MLNLLYSTLYRVHVVLYSPYTPRYGKYLKK